MLKAFRQWLIRVLTAPAPTTASNNHAVEDVPYRSTSSMVPFDENLLERSRTQWHFGDWASLAALDRDTLQHHPDRAKLAMLAAAGHAQQGQGEQARQFTRMAQDWGCSKKLISQVLISGVHNTLGRAATIGKQQHRALQHFDTAIAIGTPGSATKLLVQARSDQQVRQLVEEKNLIGRTQYTAESTLCELNGTNIIAAESKNECVDTPKAIKLDTSGANITVGDITLTEQSKKRWPYFLKIEEIQIAVFLTLIKEVKPTILFDIGANVGFYTLVTQKYFQELRCFAFEPTPDSYANLIQNLKANCRIGKVDAFQIALSSQFGTVQFGDFGDCSGKNGILATSIHDEKDIKKKLQVNTDTLDNLYPNSLGNIIVKIDTEGHEIDVLKGGKSFFSKNKLVLQIETGHKDNFRELDDLMRSFSLNLLFKLGPDSYYTNISALLEGFNSSKILEHANQFIISHRWDIEVNFDQ